MRSVSAWCCPRSAQRWMITGSLLGLGFTVAIPLSAAALENSNPQLRADLPSSLQVSTLVRSQPTLPDQILELPPLGTPERFLPNADSAWQLHLVISLSDRRVHVYDRDQLRTSFPIAIGRAGWETPPGDYAVLQMIRDPSWENPFTGEVVPPGADNPLGTRWIGFWTDGRNYIGFHGTPNVESVGQAASHGCIRMYDRDVQQLFEMVQVGTPVRVIP